MKELSRRAGVGETLVRDLEEGRTLHPRIDTMRKLAVALGVTLGDFGMAAMKGRIEACNLGQVRTPRLDGERL